MSLCLYVAAPLFCFLFVVVAQEAPPPHDGRTESGVEDYPGLSVDYPQYHDYDYNYEYDYLHHNASNVYTPFLGNLTLRKCRCQGDQVWDAGKCRNETTIVGILNPVISLVPVAANTSSFGHVQVGPLQCPPHHQVVVLDSNEPSPFRFFLTETGHLTWHNRIFKEYCVDHTLTPDGNPNSWEAHVCLLPPPVPSCCPPGHALYDNGSCSAHNETTQFRPPMEVQGQEVVWDNAGPAPLVNITCVESDTFHLRIGNADNASLQYDREGARLRWTTPTMTPKTREDLDFCVGVNKAGEYAARVCFKDPAELHHETCHKTTCVRKCCAKGSILVASGTLPPGCTPEDSNSSELWVPEFHYPDTLAPGAPPPPDLTFVYGYPICEHFFQLRPDESPEDLFYLLNDGSLHVPVFPSNIPSDRYCLDNFVMPDHVKTFPLVCFSDETDKCREVQSQFYPALLAISCVFLAVTLLVYVSVPELHAKVHGKCLVSHVTALLLAYVSLIVVQVATGYLPNIACKIMASVTHVSFLAAFFWLNVMCFDIWWTLKSMRPVAETGELSRLRFKMYSVYSWGCPVLISLVAIIVQAAPDDASLVRPDFGITKCWFDNKKSTWAYFYGFVLVLVVANIIFFCHVAYLLIMAQNDPILQRTRQQNRERMWLYVKLFLVMGLTWITEVISWQEGSCEAWIITDIINALQGFSIFLIFICKRNMLRRIRSNWEPYLRRVKELFGSSRQPPSAVTKRACTTSFSSSSVHRPNHSGASQRTVQSQISLDTASRKLSTSSLGSTTGAQVHSPSSALSMTTIAEASNQQECEDAHAEDDDQALQMNFPRRRPDDTEATGQDAGQLHDATTDSEQDAPKNDTVIAKGTLPAETEQVEENPTESEGISPSCNGSVMYGTESDVPEDASDQEKPSADVENPVKEAESVAPELGTDATEIALEDGGEDEVEGLEHYNNAFTPDNVEDVPVHV